MDGKIQHIERMEVAQEKTEEEERKLAERNPKQFLLHTKRIGQKEERKLYKT